MTDYLTTDTELTSIANAIRTKGGTSAQLSYPDGFVTAIGNISTGASGPVLNPLQGTVINASSTYTYQYEFDSQYGNPDEIFITTVIPGGYYDWGTNANAGPVRVRNKVSVSSSGLMTISPMNPSTGDLYHWVTIISFIWGTYNRTATMTASDAFLLGWNDDPCYLNGTLITLANGTQKPVEEVTYEDELLVWDFDEGKLSTAKPLWIKRAQQKIGYHHLTLESGKTLDVVGSNGKAHRLLDVDAEKFVWSTDMVGHRTMTLDGEDRLVSCEFVEEPCEFYNIVTERHINCYANDILTSCRYNNIYQIREMRFVKEKRELAPFEVYDVPRKWYDGMRLSEQTIAPEDTNKYVKRLIGIGI